MIYKAFISYSHAVDSKLAPAIQAALHRFAKPWYALRAIRTFRDKTGLSVSAALWNSIENALVNSEYFLLLASPEAAESVWVRKEVECWLRNHSTQNVLIVLTEGNLSWNADTRSFDSQFTTALPHSLLTAFETEPLWLDLRWAHTSQDLSLRNPTFIDAVATIAATLHGRPKDELIGEDVSQHGRTRRLTRIVSVLLIALTLLSASASIVAERQRREAVRQGRIALARELAAKAELALAQGPTWLERSVLLSVESLRSAPTFAGDQAVRDGLRILPRSLARLLHNKGVLQVHFSPNSSLVATGSWDGITQLWDPFSGKQLATVTDDFAPNVQAFSDDGRWLVTAGGRLAHVLDVPSLGERIRVAHDDIVRSAAIAAPHGWFATGGDDGLVRILNLSTGQEVARMFHQGAVTALAFGGDGELLVAASEDGAVAFWEPLKHMWMARCNSPVQALEITKDGRSLATASFDGTVRIWDIDQHAERFVVRASERTGILGALNTVRFSSDGKWFATAGNDGTARVFAVGDGAPATVVRHEDAVHAVAFSPGGRRIATASADGTARLWDASSGRELARLVHDRSVATVTFNADGRWLGTGSGSPTEKGEGRLWDVTAAAGTESTKLGKSDNSAFSPDGLLLVAGDRHGLVQVWDTLTDRRIASFQAGDRVTAVALSADHRWLAVGLEPDLGDADGGPPSARRDRFRAPQKWATAGIKLRLFDVLHGVPGPSIPHQDRINAIAFSPDGKSIGAATGRDAMELVHLEDLEVQIQDELPWNEVRLSDVGTGRKLGAFKHDKNVTALAFSPDGLSITTGCDDGSTRVWEIAAGRPIVTGNHEAYVHAVRFSPDGETLATASEDGTVRMWSTKTSVEIGRLFLDGAVTHLAYAPNGLHLATATMSGVVRIWDALSHEEVARTSVGGQVDALAFTGDGRSLMVESAGTELSRVQFHPEDLIEDACKRLSRNLTKTEWRQYFGPSPYRLTCPNLPPAEGAGIMLTDPFEHALGRAMKTH